MAETKPTNQQIVEMLESILEQMHQLRTDLAKLAKTV